MKTTALDSLPPIIKEVIPDRDPMTGELFKVVGVTEDGERIWLSHTLDREAMLAQREQVRDHEGNPVYRKGANQYEYPVWRVPVIWKEERFLLKAFGNAKVSKIRNWEATEEEKLREERRRIREGYMEMLVDASLEKGIMPDELVETVLASRAQGAITPDPDFEAALQEAVDAPGLPEDALPQEPPQQDPTADYSDEEIEAMLTHKGGGNYVLSDDSTVKGKAEAIQAQREIIRQQVADTPDAPDF